jgi:hypothetical protein
MDKQTQSPLRGTFLTFVISRNAVLIGQCAHDSFHLSNKTCTSLNESNEPSVRRPAHKHTTDYRANKYNEQED